MPRYGFSGEAPDMKKLILFIFHTLGEPLGERDLTQLALLDDNADYFLFSDALCGLLQNGLVERFGGLFAISQHGKEVAEVLERDIPAALRRAVTEESVAVKDRHMRAKCVISETETQNGSTYFYGTLTDGESPIFSIRLQTGGEKQAKRLQKCFEENAEAIMERVWEVMTS